MPSRVVRSELLESDRWLGLTHPVERLAYVVLLLRADDLATCDASDGRLVRMWRDACGVKGREDALRILEALVEADLVRPYEADGKRYVFIPRFRQRFRARSFKRPPPPETLLHDEPAVLENIKEIKDRASKMTDKCRSTVRHVTGNCPSVAPVVVVVGEGEDVNTTAASPSAQAAIAQAPKPKEQQYSLVGPCVEAGELASSPKKAQQYSPDFELAWASYPRRSGGNPKPRAWKAWRARLAEGHAPEAIIAGVKRYAAYIRATGKEGTEYVKQAATFFGPDRAFLEDWRPPMQAAQPPPAEDRRCACGAEGTIKLGREWYCREHGQRRLYG
ncbi:MAG: hypothetical protein KatS3mg082_1770 [Nitrospiraceae bacterium]|nr:MAG: hypothetical protein KatS3mg082_1770 [Nitrospiraceae bacterium]